MQAREIASRLRVGVGPIFSLTARIARDLHRPEAGEVDEARVVGPVATIYATLGLRPAVVVSLLGGAPCPGRAGWIEKSGTPRPR